MTQAEKMQSITKTVNDAATSGQRYLSTTGLLDIWREALLCFLGQGELTNPRGFNLKANRIISDVMTVVPRFMQYLLGAEPFYPLSAFNPEDKTARLAASNWSAFLNEHMRRAGAYQAHHDVMMFMSLYGISGLEDRVEFDIVSRPEQRPVLDPSTQSVVGYEDKIEDVVKRKFRLVPRAPWEMLFSPHGNSLHEKQTSILKDLVDPSEIRRLIDLGTFTLPHGFKDEDIDKAPDETEIGEDPMRQWTMDRSLYNNDTDNKLGVLMRYYENPSREYPRGRWAYIWNSRIPLLKNGWIDNPLMHVPHSTKPFVIFRDITPPRPDRFYGSGLYRLLRDLIRQEDDLLSIALDRLHMTSYGWWLFDPRAIDPEHMKRATYGARVPLKKTFDSTPDKAMYHVPGTDPPESIFSMRSFINTIADTRIGQHYPTTGEPAPRKEAATTNTMLRSAGDSRIENHLRLTELSSMSDHGELASCILSKYMLPADVVEVIGLERYMQAPVNSIYSVNGGYVWGFKGSTQVVMAGQQSQALQNLWALTGADPVVMRGDRAVAIRKLYKSYNTGLTDEEIERIAPLAGEMPVMTREQLMQLQSQNPQMFAQMTEQQGTSPGMPPGKIATADSTFGIVGNQRGNMQNEQAARALSRIMGE